MTQNLLSNLELLHQLQRMQLSIQQNQQTIQQEEGTDSQVARQSSSPQPVMEIMCKELVKIFQSDVNRSQFEDALGFISGICDEIPPPAVVNDIIFKILMKNCTESVANEACAYLCNYLFLLPPKSKDFVYDYREVLQDKSGNFKDIWDVFVHLIKSSFSHHDNSHNNISGPCQLVKYPNFDILTDFYAKFIIKFLSLENDLFDDNSEERFPMLLLWTNKFYKLNNPWIPVLDTLHILIDKKVNDDILNDPSQTKLDAIIDIFKNECKDIINSLDNIKGFFAKVDLPLLQSRMCHHKLYELIYKGFLTTKKHTPLTLKILIYNYFFRHSSNQHKGNKQTLSTKKCAAIKYKPLKKLFKAKKLKGNTDLHEFCRNHRHGDLLQVLMYSSDLKPNARNIVGYTPLHVACLANSYYCTRFLLEEIKKGEKVDILATDNNGLTALHCAAYANSLEITRLLLKYGGEKVDILATDNNGPTALHSAAYANSLEIARLLLKYGGAQLVKIEDNFGKKAENYTKSQELKKELKKVELSADQATTSKLPGAQLVKIEDNFGKKPENDTTSQDLKKELKDVEPFTDQATTSKLPANTDEIGTTDKKFLPDLDLDTLTVPIMNSKEEYSAFLHGLYFILSHYLDTSGLFLSKNKTAVPLSHKESKCQHYVSTVNTVVCDEDLSIFVNLPHFLDYFLNCVQTNAKNANIEICKDLMPLIALRKGLGNL